MTELEDHMKKVHNNSNELDENCTEECLKSILESISDCVKRYCENIKSNLLMYDDCEIIEKIISIYNHYMAFIIVMEEEIPSLSKLIE